MDDDLVIREAAIQHCQILRERWGDAVPAWELSRGFLVGERRIHLITWGRGIFKPKELTDGPLTLVSSITSPYADQLLANEILRYDYAPRGSNDWANEGLKRLAEAGRPVVLLEQVKPKPASEYMVFAPVWILKSDDAARQFYLGLGEARVEWQLDSRPLAIPEPLLRAYTRTSAVVRLHQAKFRKNTLAAYADRCTICDLRERPLLDAAHIVPDRLPEGVADVRNGLAVCPTHHRAYDRDLLLITEDYKVAVQRHRLEHHASEATARVLLDFDEQPIKLPRDRSLWPAVELLRKRNEFAA